MNPSTIPFNSKEFLRLKSLLSVNAPLWKKKKKEKKRGKKKKEERKKIPVKS